MLHSPTAMSTYAMTIDLLAAVEDGACRAGSVRIAEREGAESERGLHDSDPGAERDPHCERASASPAGDWT